MKFRIKVFILGIVTTSILSMIFLIVYSHIVKKPLETSSYSNKAAAEQSMIQPENTKASTSEPTVSNEAASKPEKTAFTVLDEQAKSDRSISQKAVNEPSVVEKAISEQPVIQNANNLNNNPVNINEIKKSYMSDIIKPFEISDDGKCEVNTIMEVSGVKYDKGYKLYTVNSQNCLVKFNLDNKYSKISGILGLDDKAKRVFFLVEVYGDSKLIDTYIFKDGKYSANVSWNAAGIKEFAVKGYGFTGGEVRLDLAGMVLEQAADLGQNTGNSTASEQDRIFSADNVTVKMSAARDMVGVSVGFPEGVSDVAVTDVNKSNGRFKPVAITKYEYSFFNRAGTQNSQDVKGLELFNEGEILELTLSYKYNGVQKTANVTTKIQPAF